MRYGFVWKSRTLLEPRSGGRNIAQGGVEGGTLGTESNQVEPCKGDRNAFVPIFMAVL